MTTIHTANIGSYPRTGEEKDDQRHRRGLANFENKEISAHALRDVEQSVAQEIMNEQVSCGIDEITDGLISWQDPISHFCQGLSGIQFSGPQRYFGNNFYYCLPTIVSKPRIKSKILKREYEFARTVTSKPVRSVITGPFTLAKHTLSDIKSFQKLDSRVAFFTDVVLNEVDGLVAGGVTQIQIDEPSFAQEPNKLKLVSAYLQKIKDKHPKLKIILALYFYPLTNYWDHLENLPVHGINLDLTLNTQNAWKIISDKKLPFELGLGIINALNTPMENKDTWVQLIKGLISKLSPSTLTLTPNAGLEYLPRQTARQKLTLLAQIKQDLTAPKQTSPLLHAH